jgi:SsrA-binding protein
MKIFNKRAKYEYELTGESVEAGISLMGAEAKAIREGHADLSQSHVRIMNGEAFLINANIPVAGKLNYESTRIRKLLLHKKQILSILTKSKQQKLQIVPLKLYNKGRLIKVLLELGKSKRKFEKKESIKRKDIQRDIEKEFKGSL